MQYIYRPPAGESIILGAKSPVGGRMMFSGGGYPASEESGGTGVAKIPPAVLLELCGPEHIIEKYKMTQNPPTEGLLSFLQP